MQTPKLLSIAAAAEYLGISRPTIFRRIKDGSIPVVKLGPRRFVSTATLEAILASASTGEKAAS